MRIWLAGATVGMYSLLGLVIYYTTPGIKPTTIDRCSKFVSTRQPLVAHAGGGLPDRYYANNLAALDLAAKHGHTLIELDFLERDGRLLIGHDEGHISDLAVPQLMAWLDRHPGISIVTDIKTGNLSGLAKLSNRERFIPQIYRPEQLEPVRALGYSRIIFGERYGETKPGWLPWANSADLWAVTIPKHKAAMAKQIRHQVFLYTVNEPVEGVGLYTDCLIPA